MAASKGVTLDSVVIDIETNAGKSLKNIDQLTKSLGNLKTAIKSGFGNINRLSEYIKNLNTASKKIGTIRDNVKPMGEITSKLHLLSKINSPVGVKHAAKALEELAVASQKVMSTGQNLYAVDKLIYPLTELAEIKSATGLGYTVKQLEKMSSVAPGIENMVAKAGDLPKLVEPLQSLKDIETPRGLGYITNKLGTLEETMQKFTPEALENISNVAEQLAVKLTPLAEKMNSIAQGYMSLDKLASKYGITAGRVARSTEDSSNQMKLMRDAMNGLTKTTNKLTKASTAFTKTATKGFKGLVSKLKQVGLSLLGTRTLFTAVRKAVGEYMQMDAALTKETQNLWRALGAQLAPAIEGVMYLFKQIVRVIYSVVYALTGIDLIARANAKAMNAMGKSAKDTLGSLQKFDDLNVAEFDKGSGDNNLIELDKLDLSPIQNVIEWMRKLKEEIKKAWSSGNWDGVAKVIGEGVTGALQFINESIQKIEWKNLGSTIRSAILSVDWKTLGLEIISLIKTGISSAGNLLDGLFGTTIFSDIANTINQMIDGVTKLGGSIAENLGDGTPGGEILKTIKSIFENVSSLATSIGKTIGEWVVSEEFANLMDTLKLVVEKILGYVDGITTKIKEWYESDGAKIVKDMLKHLTKIIDECLQIIVDLLDDLWVIVSWLWDNILEPVITEVGKLLNWLLGLLGDIISFIKNVFKRDWKSAFNDLANIALNVWNLIVNGFKNMINKWIGYFEKGINWIIGRINKLINSINSMLGSDLLKELGINFSIKNIPTVSLPRLETGTNEVPYEGIYHLHPGEAVVPKKYNPALGGGSNEETNQKLDTLINIMNNMGFTNVVNIGNKTIYKEQQKYNKMQNDIYGTTVNL